VGEVNTMGRGKKQAKKAFASQGATAVFLSPSGEEEVKNRSGTGENVYTPLFPGEATALMKDGTGR
jgi:hypothetical protein